MAIFTFIRRPGIGAGLSFGAALAICLSFSIMPAAAEMDAELRQAHEARLSEMFENLAAADTRRQAYAVERQIWDQWLLYGDEEVEHLMTMALRARVERNFEQAEMLLTGIVELAPDYAEAWNQRATIRYMANNHDGSLEDIAETLALEPRHFGALAGKAAILANREDLAGARAALERAVEVHPYLRGRRMLDRFEE